MKSSSGTLLPTGSVACFLDQQLLKEKTMANTKVGIDAHDLYIRIREAF